MHGGWLHLIGNMWFLWIFGDNVEDAMGHVRFVLFYLLCGSRAAGRQTLRPDPHPDGRRVRRDRWRDGCLRVLYPRAHVHMFVFLGFYVTTSAVPAIWMLGYWFVLQLLSGLALGAKGGGVAFWAHVGGFVAGALLAPCSATPIAGAPSPLWLAAARRRRRSGGGCSARRRYCARANAVRRRRTWLMTTNRASRPISCPAGRTTATFLDRRQQVHRVISGPRVIPVGDDDAVVVDVDAIEQRHVRRQGIARTDESVQVMHDAVDVEERMKYVRLIRRGGSGDIPLLIDCIPDTTDAPQRTEIAHDAVAAAGAHRSQGADDCRMRPRTSARPRHPAR